MHQSGLRYDISESFRFVNKNRRTTNATDMLIVDAYRNLMETSVSIANRFHVSDTYAHEVFDRYVKMDRLPLTDAISIDEVFLDMDEYCKYALLIQDFHTGDPIDLLRSRRVSVTEPYFVSIPPEERNAVKYLVSDMYNQYVDKYFPNAVPVVDSFHVIQWITRLIDNYIRQLLKKYRQRDRELAEQRSIELQKTVSPQLSNEVYLLQKYRWLILSSISNIKYHANPRMDSHFRCLMNTYDYEDALFRMDPIINSFIMAEKHGHGKVYDSRLSNGSMESINRKVKDLKKTRQKFPEFRTFQESFSVCCQKESRFEWRF